MKTRQYGPTLLAGIAWLAFAGGARGATITETAPFTIQAAAATNLPLQTVNVLTPQFNPALGTFESGATTITGTIGMALEFFNTGTGGPYDIVVRDTLSLAGIPGLFGQELTGVLPADQAAFIAPPATFPFGPVDRGDPAELVVGSGTWNQLFSLPFPSLTVMQGPAAVLPGIIISGSSVTTYTYTPVMAAVPEPRFSGVLALLIGFGFVARKFSKISIPIAVRSKIVRPSVVPKPGPGFRESTLTNRSSFWCHIGRDTRSTIPFRRRLSGPSFPRQTSTMSSCSPWLR